MFIITASYCIEKRKLILLMTQNTKGKLTILGKDWPPEQLKLEINVKKNLKILRKNFPAPDFSGSATLLLLENLSAWIFFRLLKECMYMYE